MATKTAIAMRQEAAYQRLLFASAHISKELGIAALEMPTAGRDPAMLRAAQMEALATWLENAAKAPKKDKQNGSTKAPRRKAALRPKPVRSGLN